MFPKFPSNVNLLFEHFATGKKITYNCMGFNIEKAIFDPQIFCSPSPQENPYGDHCSDLIWNVENVTSFFHNKNMNVNEETTYSYYLEKNGIRLPFKRTEFSSTQCHNKAKCSASYLPIPRNVWGSRWGLGKQGAIRTFKNTLERKSPWQILQLEHLFTWWKHLDTCVPTTQAMQMIHCFFL